MNITIENIPSYRIAFIRRVGPYGSDNIKIMEQLKSWASANGLLDDDSIILGIAQDTPEEVKPENCRYDTCIVISTDFLVNDNNINQGNILGGKYAVFKIEHTVQAVQKAWTEIFAEILKQGFQLDEKRPIIERYKAIMVKDGYCEICVPIL